jgi:hypothetical protein
LHEKNFDIIRDLNGSVSTPFALLVLTDALQASDWWLILLHETATICSPHFSSFQKYPPPHSIVIFMMSKNYYFYNGKSLEVIHHFRPQLVPRCISG